MGDDLEGALYARLARSSSRGSGSEATALSSAPPKRASSRSAPSVTPTVAAIGPIEGAGHHHQQQPQLVAHAALPGVITRWHVLVLQQGDLAEATEGLMRLLALCPHVTVLFVPGPPAIVKLAARFLGESYVTAQKHVQRWERRTGTGSGGGGRLLGHHHQQRQHQQRYGPQSAPPAAAGGGALPVVSTSASSDVVGAFGLQQQQPTSAASASDQQRGGSQPTLPLASTIQRQGSWFWSRSFWSGAATASDGGSGSDERQGGEPVIAAPEASQPASAIDHGSAAEYEVLAADAAPPPMLPRSFDAYMSPPIVADMAAAYGAAVSGRAVNGVQLEPATAQSTERLGSHSAAADRPLPPEWSSPHKFLFSTLASLREAYGIPVIVFNPPPPDTVT